MTKENYEVGIDEGNVGTRTIASFSTEKDAQSFLYDYSLKHPEAKLFIDTCTEDLFKTLGDMFKPPITKGIDLFEDYTNIPPQVQDILNEHEEDFQDGNYIGLNKALKKLEKTGYTFDYYLDGIAYDLRPIGTMGMVEYDSIH